MTPSLLIPLALVFVSVATASGMLVAYLLRRTSAVERRLRGIAEPAPAPAALAPSKLDLTRPSYGRMDRYVGLVLKSSKELSVVRRRLTSAGFERQEAAVIFAALEIALPILVGALVLWYVPPPRGIVFGLGAAAVAYMAPGLWLGQRMAERRRQIQNGLPDALDLLLVTMEAGSAMDQAILKVSTELRLAYPVLAAELRHVITEIRAGRPRAEALRHLAERTKVDDVRALVMTLIQTDRFGTSVGQALRTHADVARTRRRQRAEERAQKLGVKLVFPLVFCLFPAMYVVVLGPASLRIMRILGNGLGN